MKNCLIISLFLAAAAVAQPQTPPKPAIIEGKVVSSVGGEPLRKVELTLTTDLMADNMEAMAAMFGGGSDPGSKPAPPKPARKSFAATTDAAGKFRFDPVDAGDYFLTAKHAGYVDGTYKPEGKYALDGKVHLQPGDSLTEVTIRLVPQGALSGRVLDEDGDPVAGASVSAQSYSYSAGKRRLIPADSALTNDRGEFRLGKLRPGRYYLSADRLMVSTAALTEAPPPPKDGAPETGYVSTYYPGTVDAMQATAIDVAAGADASGFNIQLQKSKVVRIKGKAVNADGTPMKSGQIMLMNPMHPGSMQMKMLNNPEGRFEIANVAPGTYMLMMMQMGGATPSVHMQPLTVTAEGLDNVQVGAQQEGTVQGSLTVAGDGKVAIHGLMVMISGGMDMPVMPVMGTVSEAGAFTLQKVNAAPYQLTLPRTPDGTYLKSVQWGGRERLGQPIDFTAGFGGTLEIVLGTDGGEFEATVSHDDKPAADATVVLIAADPAARMEETTRTGDSDAQGHVALKDVPPGSYLALAWEKVDAGDWFDPVFLKAVESQAASVTIRSKSHEKAQLQMIPAK
jgi:uncharacterized GH25 family protein